MRTNRRIDNHHLTATGIGELFEKLRAAVFPNAVATDEFKKFLYAVQNVERNSAKDVKSGRRPRFARERLVAAASQIRGILAKETAGRVSLLYFISTALPALDYPPDVRAALDAHKINLDEARSLARINKKNLGENVLRKSVEIRRELLESHLKRAGTQKELRERVSARLNTTPKAQAAIVSHQISALDGAFDDLLEMNEYDTDHLFWEEIKSLVFLAREIDPGVIGDDALDDIFKTLDNLKLKLLKFKPNTEGR